MKKGLFLISLIVTVLIVLAGCQREATTVASNTIVELEAPSVIQKSEAAAKQLPFNAPAEPSCASPTAGLAQECVAIEQRILAATVRLEFHGPNGGIGHGTIKDGRYLVTHNHYPVSAAALAKGAESGVTAVSVFQANGDIILLEAPLSFFTVAAEYPETLVLDSKEYGGTELPQDSEIIIRQYSVAALDTPTPGFTRP